LAGVRKIAGTGALRFDISSHGNTPRAIVSHLDGNGEISLSEGSVEGADLAAVAHLLETVLSGEMPSEAVGESAQTPFDRLSASFSMQDGVLHSTDVKLLNPAVEIDGTADIDLPAQRLELHFDPRPAPGRHNSGIGVPFYVKGPWAKPSFGPDTHAVAKTLLKRADAANTLDLLTRPGLSLKSILGRQKPASN